MGNNPPKQHHTSTGYQTSAAGLNFLISYWVAKYPQQAWYEGFARPQGYYWTTWEQQSQPPYPNLSGSGPTRYDGISGASPEDLASLCQKYPEIMQQFHQNNPPPPGVHFSDWYIALAAGAVVGGAVLGASVAK